MSFHTWHNYGYGICTDDIQTDADRIRALIHMAPPVEAQAKRDFEMFTCCDDDYEHVEWEELAADELCDAIELDCGMAGILAAVIQECEDIEMCACDDINGKTFLIYQPSYPWQVHDDEKAKMCSEENAKALMQKYVSVLTDQELEYGYQSVENGG